MSFSSTLWQSLHHLNPEEKNLISRYEAEPSGAIVIGVADLLRKRGYVDESLILLEEGISKFSNFTALRVALAREYFQRGLLKACQEQLSASLSRNPDNLLALRIQLKVAILYSDKPTVYRTLESLRQSSIDDDSTKIIRQFVGWGDFSHAKKHVLAQLEKQGIQIEEGLVLEAENSASNENPTVKSSLGTILKPSTEITMGWSIPKLDPTDSPSNLQKINLDSDTTPQSREWEEQSRKCDNASLPHVFKPADSLGHLRGNQKRYQLLRDFRMISVARRNQAPPLNPTEGIEPVTLIELYLQQGHWESAKKLLQNLRDQGMDEKNEFFRNKLLELEMRLDSPQLPITENIVTLKEPPKPTLTLFRKKAMSLEKLVSNLEARKQLLDSEIGKRL